MGGDVAFADADGLGEFTQAGLHRGALASDGLLALALGGDAETCLGQSIGSLGLGLAEQGDPSAGRGAFLTGRGKTCIRVLQLLLESRNATFQFAEMDLQGGNLAVENLVAVADILEFARGKQMISLRGGEESLGIAKVLAGLTQSVDGGLQCGERSLAGEREAGKVVPLGLDLTLEGSDLGVAEQS